MILATTTPVISRGTFTAVQVETSILAQRKVTRYTPDQVRRLVARTLYWCDIFGVNADIVFAQMIHETNWFRYTGDVPFGSHNFAGLGATGGVPGHRFETIDAGVLAVVAHHAVYRWGARENWPAHLQQYAGEATDPRYEEVLSTDNEGTMIVLDDYRGTWAVPGHTYPESLINRSRQIEAFPRGEEQRMTDVPGVAWVPADENHYRPGRNDPWPYYLIGHHTDGFDSLNYLTITPGSQVSAHYLFWTDGTIRSQMVRHADTAWTTGYMNDDGICVEWERYWTDPARREFADGVPAEVYRNMGDSWAKIVLAERARGNPYFQRVPKPDQLRDHNDFYATSCPGNLDIGIVYLELVRVLESGQVTPPVALPENPNAKAFPSGHWIVNTEHNGTPVEMLDFFEREGGIIQIGMPLEGMHLDEDGVFRQGAENAIMELWTNGFGNQPGPLYRFGRYLDHVDRLREQLTKGAA